MLAGVVLCVVEEGELTRAREYIDFGQICLHGIDHQLPKKVFIRLGFRVGFISLYNGKYRPPTCTFDPMASRAQ